MDEMGTKKATLRRAMHSAPGHLRRWTAGCCVLIFASGCERPDNIQPGESTYPIENVRPTHILHLAGLLPSSLPLLVEVNYVAEKGGFGDTSKCSFLPNARGPSPFSIRERVKVTRTGDGYKADVAFDKYLPGRCQWTLDAIAYWVGGSEVQDQSKQNPDAYVNAAKWQVVKPAGPVGDLQQEFECSRRSRNEGQGGEVMTCNTADPGHKTLYPGPDTTRITIDFRDVASDRAISGENLESH